MPRVTHAGNHCRGFPFHVAGENIKISRLNLFINFELILVWKQREFLTAKAEREFLKGPQKENAGGSYIDGRSAKLRGLSTWLILIGSTHSILPF